MTESFKVAPFGTTAWIWTVSFVVGLIYFGGRTILALASGFVPDTFDSVAAVMLVPLVIYAWIRSVRGYRLQDGIVIIDRAGPGKINIPVSEIEQVDGNPDVGTFFNMGILSIGGVFGWAGRVRVRKPADVKSMDVDVYGTNPKNSVLLEMKNGTKIILTPADPQAMETSLRIAGAGARPSSTAVGSRSRTARRKK
ncbi:MAG: PH domain-containing protein [Chloroflexota bacterium]